MNEVLKKIKHLRATFLQYAHERSVPGAWTDELKDDFEKILYTLFPKKKKL